MENIILTNEEVKEQNGFHVTHIPSVLRLEPWSIFTQNLVTHQCTTIQRK